jgi:DNA polymerase
MAPRSSAPAETPASDIRTLANLAAAEAECARCPLYRDATQAVPGEGPRQARLILIGEQPGDQEDVAGRPFVGPAGRILDRALSDAGIPRDDVFITNAVKHFKYERSGKRRLHKRPNANEIHRCRRWLDIERALVKPNLLVAMGATAVHSVFGRALTISALRGTIHTLDDGAHALVTLHPSALLRTRDEVDRAAKYEALVGDLAAGAAYLKAN